MLVFGKILRTYLMDDPYGNTAEPRKLLKIQIVEWSVGCQ